MNKYFARSPINNHFIKDLQPLRSRSVFSQQFEFVKSCYLKCTRRVRNVEVVVANGENDKSTGLESPNFSGHR